MRFGGWRADEFGLRLEGASYQEIAAAGGGISSTVAATRAASTEALRAKANALLDKMLELGVTTVECKSGYGLDTANELKLLEVADLHLRRAGLTQFLHAPRDDHGTLGIG